MYTTNNISDPLLHWYKKSKRSMPWRKTKDPYNIWLSEIMLQQTQVKTVIPFYNTWIEKFPNFESVAKAQSDSLLLIWEGLGYYNRCHNFHKAVKIIVKKYNSCLPANIEDFLVLPGVGIYTASAVYSIVFSYPIPVVDGNVNRVMSRLLRLKRFTPFNKKRILSTLNKCIDKNHPGNFNQALMELGSIICIPKTPKCHNCPLKSYCGAAVSGNPGRYPLAKTKKHFPWKNVVVGLIWENSSFLILKRAGYKHLNNLWELPGGKVLNKQNPKSQLVEMLKKKYNLDVSIENKIGEVCHRYSHFGISMSSFDCKIKNRSKLMVNQPYRWIKKHEINQFAFPKANHKIFSSMLEN